MYMKRRSEVYQDSAGEWRWRVKAGNNEVIATSGEGYVNESHARKMVDTLFPPEPVTEE